MLPPEVTVLRRAHTRSLGLIEEVTTRFEHARHVPFGGASEKWAAALSRQWMEADPQAVGTLYIDGHVRVYHGSKTKLPRKYVSRQRLCLRGTTDYWVNDLTGKPFFVIDKVVDSGFIDALHQDIVPRLLCDVPGQPTDLACLLRRLKHRLKTPETHLCCVGTSATVGGDLRGARRNTQRHPSG